MRRIYHQFYLTIIASLLGVVVIAAALWRFAPTETPSDQAFEMAGHLLAAGFGVRGYDVRPEAVDALALRFRRRHHLMREAGCVGAGFIGHGRQ